MKKKMVGKIVFILLVLLIVFFIGWYFLFCHVGVGPAFPFLPEQEVKMESTAVETLGESQLMTFAETEEQAKEIAEQYGIEFVSLEEGIAVYTTEEKVEDVIARGKENGYPELYLNYVKTVN
ncbi:MAG: hypothetical protein J6B68_01990 [Lachnospiraceae bacterium]|nr:hypothetical protein [Lachnospiraceae bacterium]MBO5353657.1 hypothetical protein [Lachnospiraceae bacterium]